MKTKHAPAERLSKQEIGLQYMELQDAEFIQNIFDSLPYIAAVLNAERQIVFSNNKLLDDLGIKNIQDILGSRVGEMMKCANAEKEEGGCGTSEDCRYCGAVNSILKSQKNNKKVESECTIVSDVDGEKATFEFGIVVNPFEFENSNYYILSLFDISDTKRRLFLEKIFFHDIINKAGSLNGFLQLIKGISDPLKLDEYIKTLDDISQQLIKEIFSQKQLIEAENGTLSVNNELIESKQFLESMLRQISQHEVGKGINFVLSEVSESINFISDTSLLGRIILNMLKNAAEASEKDDTVEVRCFKSKNNVVIAVKNPVYITEEIQSRIFNRSFSTKGTGRGLGTYSMKILAENYLKGKIYFESSEKEGTSFYLEINAELTLS